MPAHVQRELANQGREDLIEEADSGISVGVADGFLLSAYLDLDSERITTEAGPNPIPHSAILRYCQMMELSEDDTLDVIYLVRKLDNAFLSDHAEKMKKLMSKSNGKSKISSK